MTPVLARVERDSQRQAALLPRVGSPHLPAEVNEDLIAVEEALVARLASDVSGAQEIGRYAVSAGGKRVRPTVLLLFSRSLDAPVERARDLAMVVEWVHVASLLHDDVIDAATERRGKAAAHQLWGEHAAIMTGDYLLARAIEILLRHGDADGAGRTLGAAVAQLAEGEILEARLRGRLDATIEEVQSVADRKTAALLEWACRAGAMAGGGDAATVTGAARYGAELGRAFQLADDALDYADEAVTGKDLLADLRAGLPTRPLLHAIGCRPGLRDQVETFLAGGATDEEAAQAIGAEVRAAGGVRITRSAAREAARAAIEALRPLPTGPHRRALARLARYVARRLT